MKIVNRKLTTKKIEPRAKIVPKVKEDFGDGLPMKKTVGRYQPLGLKYLVIAPPGWGKTELFSTFPDTLLLFCEEGHMFVEGYKVIIDCFDYKGKDEIDPWTDKDGNMHMSFIQAVDMLETSERFKFVSIDTVDALVKMVQDFFVVSKRVEHISDIGDYGKGFDVGQNAPFRRAINRILKSGRGVGLITHQEIVTSKFKAGERAKKLTTLPNGIAKQIVPQMDIVLHGIYGSKRKPNKFKDRIITTAGTEEILAKNRGGILPESFILPPTGQWEFFESLFLDPKARDKAAAQYEKLYEA